MRVSSKKNKKHLPSTVANSPNTNEVNATPIYIFRWLTTSVRERLRSTACQRSELCVSEKRDEVKEIEKDVQISRTTLTSPYPPNQKQLDDQTRKAAEEDHRPKTLDDMVEIRRLSIVRYSIRVACVCDEGLVRSVEDPREEHERLKMEGIVREALGVVVQLVARRAPQARRETRSMSAHVRETEGEHAHDADEQRAHLGCVSKSRATRQRRRRTVLSSAGTTGTEAILQCQWCYSLGNASGQRSLYSARIDAMPSAHRRSSFHWRSEVRHYSRRSTIALGRE